MRTRIGEEHGRENQQLQSGGRDAESSNLFSSTKTRIEPLEVNIAEVMGERSHNAKLTTATMSQKSVLDHDILHQQCYSWLRKAKHRKKEKGCMIRARSE